MTEISSGQSKFVAANRSWQGHSAAFSTKRLPMIPITMSASIRATRAGLLRIAIFLGILVLCFSAAATRVERCRTIGADFDARSFGDDFSIHPRTVCATESIAFYAIGDVLGYLTGG
jgi:hypothetical protein